MRSRTIFGIIVVVIICAIAAGFFFYRQGTVMPTAGVEASTTPQGPIGTIVSATSSSRQVPAGSKEYRSSQFHFSVIYPDDLSVKQYNEGGGAATIAFQNPKEAKGFQVFIVPYSGTQVSEQRFKEDEPSGVRDNPKNITIDGATATSFYSTNLTLGATAEIWFIHDGYLYEVTTLKPLASWFSGIMQTWKFL